MYVHREGFPGLKHKNSGFRLIARFCIVKFQCDLLLCRFQNRRMKQKKRMKEKNFASTSAGGINLNDNASDDSNESPSPVHTVASSTKTNNKIIINRSSSSAKDDFSFTRL